MVALTRAENKLRSEIEAIASIVEMDIWNIEQHKRGPQRAYFLQEMKRKFVCAEVITRYTLLDEFLTDIICDYYFHRPNKKITYRRLWKTKHFKIFVHYIMDEAFLLKKLAAVEAIITLDGIKVDDRAEVFGSTRLTSQIAEEGPETIRVDVRTEQPLRVF